MYILISVQDGDIVSQLPDRNEFFKQQEIVTIEGQMYLFADYIGDEDIHSDYNVELYLQQQHSRKVLPLLTIDNVTEQIEGYRDAVNEFTVPQQSNQVVATGKLAMPDCKLKIPFKRIDTGRIQLMPAQVVDGVLSMVLKFETNGIWVITQALFEGDMQSPVFETHHYRFSVL
ncbi:hypothetical protein [Pseudoalteromonas sp. MMG022]|uniref:hypothetical protein n=1 Tax=Pseudoalteromonas sp. MMG022 TaxID=2909978 RepID=UPI001F16F79C|nr:hypothetical protein [Pseudoalteromonas sp. MMG022]MCF6435222.1 hypothetical protein [Pseudoalteromonas sp. MMG022]